MKQIRLFQVFVIASTFSYVVWFFFPYISGRLANPLYLEIEQQVGQYAGLGALLPVHHPFYYGTWFSLWLIASLGLFFFQNWARHLFLFLYVLGTLLTLVSGFSAQGPMENFFGGISTVLDGAILAMAYLSPLADGFRTTPGSALNRTHGKRRRAPAS